MPLLRDVLGLALATSIVGGLTYGVIDDERERLAELPEASSIAHAGVTAQSGDAPSVEARRIALAEQALARPRRRVAIASGVMIVFVIHALADRSRRLAARTPTRGGR